MANCIEDGVDHILVVVALCYKPDHDDKSFFLFNSRKTEKHEENRGEKSFRLTE